MKGIKYICPVFDPTGYGEASRNHLMSLIKANVPITIQRIQYEPTEKELYGEMGETLSQFIDRLIDYDVVVQHLTPEHFPRFKEAGKINIGFMYWETSRIPEQWVGDINNHVDAVFVVCDYTVDSLHNSGITVPVYKILPAMNAEYFKSDAKVVIPGLSYDVYKFYSIFQWTERKNPGGLLKAYLTTFTNDDKVELIIKTYVNDTSTRSRDFIRQEIINLKGGLQLPADKYPPIRLLWQFLTRDEVIALHRLGDCFVLPHRSEGLGMPHLEAMFAGKPVISTDIGGNVEFMFDANSYLISHQLTPVFGMGWAPWYKGNQLWGEPNIKELMDKMRYVYDHQNEAIEVARKAKIYVEEKYTYESSSKTLIDVINKVEDRVSTVGLKFGGSDESPKPDLL